MERFSELQKFGVTIEAEFRGENKKLWIHKVQHLKFKLRLNRAKFGFNF